jgi:tellurite resistance protein TehA-like permease
MTQIFEAYFGRFSREIIRPFTPNWFAVTMGTGILALALNQVPLAIPGLHVIAESLWALNIALFLLFSGLYAARWMLFPSEAKRIFGHSAVSMLFGTIPMGLATINSGFVSSSCLFCSTGWAWDCGLTG